MNKKTESRIYLTVVILISMATFRHSAMGFASFEGSVWLGIPSALAVDALMVLFMYSLRNEFRWRIFFAMCFPMAISIFTQLLYATEHAQLVSVGPGADWLEQRATDIINMRVWLLPVSLPVSALLAALVGESEQEQSVPATEHAQVKAQLEALQANASKARLSATADQAELAKLRSENDAHQARLERLRSDESTRSASALVRALRREIYSNGNAPATRVLAEALGVSEQTIRKATADAQTVE